MKYESIKKWAQDEISKHWTGVGNTGIYEFFDFLWTQMELFRGKVVRSANVFLDISCLTYVQLEEGISALPPLRQHDFDGHLVIYWLKLLTYTRPLPIEKQSMAIPQMFKTYHMNTTNMQFERCILGIVLCMKIGHLMQQNLMMATKMWIDQKASDKKSMMKENIEQWIFWCFWAKSWRINRRLETAVTT